MANRNGGMIPMRIDIGEVLRSRNGWTAHVSDMKFRRVGFSDYSHKVCTKYFRNTKKKNRIAIHIYLVDKFLQTWYGSGRVMHWVSQLIPKQI